MQRWFETPGFGAVNRFIKWILKWCQPFGEQLVYEDRLVKWTINQNMKWKCSLRLSSTSTMISPRRWNYKPHLWSLLQQIAFCSSPNGRTSQNGWTSPFLCWVRLNIWRFCRFQVTCILGVFFKGEHLFCWEENLEQSKREDIFIVKVFRHT